MPCAQARRRQPSSRVQAQAYLSMLRSEEAAEATGPALQCVYHDARPRAGGASAPHAARRPHCHTVERKSEIARGHRARVCGLWSNHCMILAIWTQ